MIHSLARRFEKNCGPANGCFRSIVLFAFSHIAHSLTFLILPPHHRRRSYTTRNVPRSVVSTRAVGIRVGPRSYWGVDSTARRPLGTARHQWF
jgi:hypothetical protein